MNNKTAEPIEPKFFVGPYMNETMEGTSKLEEKILGKYNFLRHAHSNEKSAQI